MIFRLPLQETTDRLAIGAGPATRAAIGGVSAKGQPLPQPVWDQSVSSPPPTAAPCHDTASPALEPPASADWVTQQLDPLLRLPSPGARYPLHRQPSAYRRAALRQWGFNAKRRADCPQDAAVIFAWLSRNTKPVSALTDPTVMRAVLDAAVTQLNGQPAAPWTARTNRAILARR